VPLRDGREVEALRRLQRAGLTGRRIEISLSPASLEPGIFGIVRPVLIWPEGISERLEDGHLEAILAHELWHVRRRDNLTAAIHMVVEAIFWYHPLVWWLGTRLAEERELACDEEVLQLVGERQVYAESILKVCEFCVGSPLACVSGVTGADLKKRIVHIMNQRVVRKLDFSRKLLLCAAGLMAVALPIVVGLMNATQSQAQSQGESPSALTPAYEVIKVKQDMSGGEMFSLFDTPDGLTATGATLQMLIRAAYDVEDNQIAGAPALTAQKYDIEAKIDKSVFDDLQKSSDQGKMERRRMLQALLADRFKLALHRETKELPVYMLVIAKNGPKLQSSKPGDTYPNGIKGSDGRGHPDMMLAGSGWLTGQGLPMAGLVRLLSQQLGRIVLDKTGLMGNYDFTMRWTPNNGQLPMSKGTEGTQQATENTLPSETSGPSIFTAIQEQLGLELKSQTAPVGILVIDHAETPSEQ